MGPLIVREYRFSYTPIAHESQVRYSYKLLIVPEITALPLFPDDFISLTSKVNYYL